MRGLGPFLAYRLVRMLIALWSVVTVVFIVMRLSGWRHRSGKGSPWEFP
ncbi:MAG: hypothetical protein ACHQ7N_18670 [Candidatus Methylomirabilales bacterium]